MSNKKKSQISNNQLFFIVSICVGFVIPVFGLVINPLLGLFIAYAEGLATPFLMRKYFRETLDQFSDLPLLGRILKKKEVPKELPKETPKEIPPIA